jgi:hypothetical protein
VRGPLIVSNLSITLGLRELLIHMRPATYFNDAAANLYFCGIGLVCIYHNYAFIKERGVNETLVRAFLDF